MLLVAAMIVSICASAQFQEGKGYLGASLTGLDLHYNGQDGCAGKGWLLPLGQCYAACYG